MIGIVGILDDVTKAVPSAFQKAGDSILLLTLPVGTTGTHPEREFGSSEFAKLNFGMQWGTPPSMQLLEEFELHNALRALAREGLIHSACDVSDGGLAVSLAKASLPNNIGVWAMLAHGGSHEADTRELFGEDSSLALITCDPKDVARVRELVDEFGFVFPLDLGNTTSPVSVTGDRTDFEIWFGTERSAIQTTVSSLRSAYSNALASQLVEEVLA